MPEAVGVIETVGFPGVLAAADAMVKGGNVTLVTYQKAESGEYYVAIRGSISEVRRGVEAGLEAVEQRSHGAKVQNYYIVPNPPENIVTILEMGYSEDSKPFR